MRFSKSRLAFTLAAVAVLCGHVETRDRAHAADDKCTGLEHQVDAQVYMLGSVADQIGGFEELGHTALEGVKSCPDSARLWYLAVRSAEVLGGWPVFDDYGGTKAIAADASKHAPQSVQVATVVARLDGSVASAQNAYDLDHNYGPARNALALALSREGSAANALKLLEGHTGVEDHLARARILLRDSKPAQAATEARTALKTRASPVEPTLGTDILREGNEILAFALLTMGRTKEAIGPLKTAAATGSAAARSELAKRR